MDFSLSDEQTLLRNSVEKFVNSDYPFEVRQQISRSEPGFSRDIWNMFAELGWLGVPFAEVDGGFGGTAVDVMLIMEQFGRGLVVEPFLSTVLLAGGALKYAGNEAQKARYLPELIGGRALGALAFVEAQARYNIADLATRAQTRSGGFVLSGEKSVVLGGPSADFFVVSARTGGERTDTEGVSLFLVAADAPGLTRRDYPTVDGFRASELIFDDVELGEDALLGDPGKGYSVLERVLDEATFAVSAEAVGCMEVLYKSTVEYCKTREQFGQPIGKFQVLQHRMVDMFMEHEQSVSLMYLAAMRLDEGYDEAAQRAVSALKAQVGRSGRFVGQNAIQLHGAMGMTDELAVGHYFKRLTMIDTLFGNVDHHMKRFGVLQGESAR